MNKIKFNKIKFNNYKMKKKFKIITIEDIALQFIKNNESKINKNEVKDLNDTFVDSKYFVKKHLNSKNSDSLLSQSFEKLFSGEDKPEEDEINKLKIITFYKVPPKILGDDDEFFFDSLTSTEKKNNNSNSKIISQNTYKLISNGDIKLREIKPIKYDKKLIFNINYENAYDCLSEIYSPLLQNLETINSFKSKAEDTMSRIEFFFSHSSIFELNQNNNINNILSEIMEEIKTFEVIEFIFVIFILHIILDAKIEYIDNFNEEDIIVIYQTSFSVLLKLYEIIILMLLLNENNKSSKNNSKDIKNNENNKDSNHIHNETNSNDIDYESFCSKYIKEFYKFEPRPNNNEEIINKINENVYFILKSLFNLCNILFGNLILFKKESGNLELPDEEEIVFLNSFKKNDDLDNDQKKQEKTFLSKEFNDQYSCFKTMYLYFTKDNLNETSRSKNTINKEKENNIKEDTDNNYSPTESSVILTRLSTVFSAYKELINCFLLYYTNFKILIEKNKVKPPYLPPLNTKKYLYTLVLDLDETLVHYIEEENRAYVQVRPYADYFLSEMGKYFEIVIFTAAAEDYADIVLNELDKNNAIAYKLYRKHTEQVNGVFIKDLSKLGRDISKILIIDNNKENFSLQPENGLHICSFVGDQNDDELFALCEDLMKIVNSKEDDIRPIIKEIDDIMKMRYKEKDIALE